MGEEKVLLQKPHLTYAAIAFASYVTEKYPQISAEGRLNYYVCGSLAVMLLSQADSVDLLNSRQLPNISARETKKLDDIVLSKLGVFTRKIGDFDYVETDVYKEAKGEIPSYSDDPEGYRRERRKFLFKGGGGPSIDELPELARKVLEIPDGMTKVMCDPVSTYSEDQVARVRIQDQEYFISDPSQIFGYKVLHLMQSFCKKPNKFKKDFTILHDALSQLYSEEELIESAYHVLIAFEDSKTQDGPQASKYMKELIQNPHFDSTVKSFFERFKNHDSKHRNIMLN